MSKAVCLSVRSHNSKTTRPIFTKFLFMLPIAAWLRFSPLVLWYVMCFRFCGWLFMFLHSRLYGESRVLLFLNGQNYCIDSNQFLFNNKDQQVHIVVCAPGAKSVVYECRVIGVFNCSYQSSYLIWPHFVWTDWSQPRRTRSCAVNRPSLRGCDQRTQSGWNEINSVNYKTL